MNKAKTLKYLLPLLNLIPQPIAKLPYQLALNHFQHQLKPLGIEVWARNSFQTRRLTLALSDLDLTFYTNRTIFIKKKNLILQSLLYLRKRYPFVGEINFYFDDDLALYKDCANSWELERDPILQQKMGLIRKHSFQKIAFLNQMLLSDLHQLTINVRLRVKKWQPYIGTYFNQASFIDAFLRALEPYPFQKEEYQEFWIQVFEQSPILNAKLELIHFPNRFQVLSSLEIIDLSNEERQLLAAHINWEIWGLMSQRPLEAQPQQTIDHLMRIAALSQRHQLELQYQQCKKLCEDIAHLHLL